MVFKKSFLIILVASMMYGCCGTALFVGGAAAGAGAALYISGALEKEFNVSSTRLWKAVQSAAKALKFNVLSKSEKDKKNVLTAKDKNDKNIKLEVLPLTGDRSKLIIRVGTFGDEAYSRKILKTVEARL
jgi:hypothetical protein